MLKMGPSFGWKCIYMFNKKKIVTVKLWQLGLTLKVSMKGIKFFILIRKGFQNDKDWHLFHGDSTLGCMEAATTSIQRSF